MVPMLAPASKYSSLILSTQLCYFSPPSLKTALFPEGTDMKIGVYCYAVVFTYSRLVGKLSLTA